MGTIWSLLRGKDQACRVLMIGLDAAGKTTLLYKWKFPDETLITIPTIGFAVETVTVGNCEIIVWDVNGGERARPMWRHYFQNTNAVLFVVDCNDGERLKAAADELKWVAAGYDDTVYLPKEVPFVIVANKQDLAGALSPEVLAEELNLRDILKHRNWVVLPTVAHIGEGTNDILLWLADALTPENRPAGHLSNFACGLGQLKAVASAWWKR